jgi:hypothetical protein
MNRVAMRFLYFRGPFYGPDSFALAQLHQLNSTISKDRGWGITAIDFTADLTWFKASFSSQNRGEKHCIRISVAFCLYLIKIIQILTN